MLLSEHPGPTCQLWNQIFTTRISKLLNPQLKLETPGKKLMPTPPSGSMMPHDFTGGTLGQVPMHTIFVCNPPYSWSRGWWKKRSPLAIWRFFFHPFCRTGWGFYQASMATNKSAGTCTHQDLADPTLAALRHAQGPEVFTISKAIIPWSSWSNLWQCSITFPGNLEGWYLTLPEPSTVSCQSPGML